MQVIVDGRSLVWSLITAPIVGVQFAARHIAIEDRERLDLKHLNGAYRAVANASVRRESVRFSAHLIMLAIGLISLRRRPSRAENTRLDRFVVAGLYAFQLLMLTNSVLDLRDRAKVLSRVLERPAWWKVWK